MRFPYRILAPVLLAACLCPGASPAAAADRGRISGEIRSASGHPLQNALVTIVKVALKEDVPAVTGIRSNPGGLFSASDQKSTDMSVFIKVQTAVRPAVIVQNLHLYSELLFICRTDPYSIQILFIPADSGSFYPVVSLSRAATSPSSGCSRSSSSARATARRCTSSGPSKKRMARPQDQR